MSNSIIEIGKLSEPVTKLIETIATGIGGIYAPMGVVRQAKASAKAEIIRAESQEKIASIEQRTKHRLEYTETIRQENLERIIAQAALDMPENVSNEAVSQDWVLQFVALAQNVCDEDIQRIWARILAGEVANPGSFGKRTLEFLKTLEKTEAEYFTLLSGFAFLDEHSWPFLIADNITYEHIAKLSNNADLIRHFTAIGLLSNQESLRVRSSLLGNRYQYFGQTVEFVGTPKKNTTGDIQLLEHFTDFKRYTSIGAQLFQIAGATPCTDYVEKLSASLKNSSLSLELRIVANNGAPFAV